MNNDNSDKNYAEIQFEPQFGQPPQTKLCKYCCSEMDVRASVCPSCRRKQSHPLLTALLIATAVFIGLPFCVGFVKGFTGSTKKSSQVSEVSRSDTVTPSSEQTQKTVVYNKNGILIYYTGIEELSSRYELKFLIENNTDIEYCVQERNFSVNGYMVSSSISAKTAPHKKNNDRITIFKSSLEKNNISDIKDIEFNFHIFDWNDWTSGFDSDTIKINVEQ